MHIIVPSQVACKAASAEAAVCVDKMIEEGSDLYEMEYRVSKEAMLFFAVMPSRYHVSVVEGLCGGLLGAGADSVTGFKHSGTWGCGSAV